jgi:hypothetical protein
MMTHKAKHLTSIILALIFALNGVAFLGQPVSAAPAGDAASSVDVGQPGQQEDPGYREAIQRTANMVWAADAQSLAAAHDLHVVNVTWEDTGRYYGSAVGPNISDVTIQVGVREPRTEQFQLTLMPVIRYPNFSDLSADIPLDSFYLLIGNERGEALRRVSLREYLANIRRYLSEPDSWAGSKSSLLAERDSHVLVSAQAAFLPIPRQGRAEFNPVIFNYQSYAGDPAVLTIVATREGTSATIIDNVRDAFPSGFSWGQRLFFNQNGERASFAGERLSDFNTDNRQATDPAMEAAGQSGLNMVMLIQVPLKQKQTMMGDTVVYESAAAPAAEGVELKSSDVEAAVISHGEVEGPFTEIDGLEIERDERFPIRVTVQFYKATSNGVVSAADMEEIAAQIQRVYEDADYVGSLVVDGPSERPTEHDGPKTQPADWWDGFWKRFESNTGVSRQEALDLLRRLNIYPGRWIEVVLRPFSGGH